MVWPIKVLKHQSCYEIRNFRLPGVLSVMTLICQCIYYTYIARSRRNPGLAVGIIILFVCNFYFIPKIAVRNRFLDFLKNLLCNYFVCIRILVFSAIHTIVTDMEGNIRTYTLPLGRGTIRTSENLFALVSGSGNIILTGPYHAPWAVCMS